MPDYHLRPASTADAAAIWQILQQAIARRHADGSAQWQDGYPNPDVVASDIARGVGFLLCHDAELIGYCAIIADDEPAYAAIEGRWLSDGPFVVVHRMAIDELFLRQGCAFAFFGEIAQYALARDIKSIKVDTNFDNAPMLHILERLGFSYCGDIHYRGAARMAFEKILGDSI